MPQEEIPPLDAILDGSGVRYYSKRTRQPTSLEKKLEVAREAFYAARKQHGLPGPPRISPASGSAPSRTTLAEATASPPVSTAVLRREIRRKACERDASSAGAPSATATSTAPTPRPSAAAPLSARPSVAAVRDSAGSVNLARKGGGGGGASNDAASAPQVATQASLRRSPSRAAVAAAAAAATAAVAAANAASDASGGDGKYQQFGDPLAAGSGRGPVVVPQPYHTDARTYFHLSLLPTSVSSLANDNGLYYMPAGATRSAHGGPGLSGGPGLRDGMIRYYQPDLGLDREERQRREHLQMAERLAKAQEALGDHIQSVVAAWGPSFLDRLVTAASAEGVAAAGARDAAGLGGPGGKHNHKLALSAGGLDVPASYADGMYKYDRQAATAGHHRHPSPAPVAPTGAGGGTAVHSGSAGGGGGGGGGNGGGDGGGHHVTIALGPEHGRGHVHISPANLERLSYLAEQLKVPVETIVHLIKKVPKKGGRDPAAALKTGKAGAAKGGAGKRVAAVAGARQSRRVELVLSRKVRHQPTQGQASGGRSEEEGDGTEGGDDAELEGGADAAGVGAGTGRALESGGGAATGGGGGSIASWRTSRPPSQYGGLEGGQGTAAAAAGTDRAAGARAALSTGVAGSQRRITLAVAAANAADLATSSESDLEREIHEDDGEERGVDGGEGSAVLGQGAVRRTSVRRLASVTPSEASRALRASVSVVSRRSVASARTVTSVSAATPTTAAGTFSAAVGTEGAPFGPSREASTRLLGAEASRTSVLDPAVAGPEAPGTDDGVRAEGDVIGGAAEGVGTGGEGGSGSGVKAQAGAGQGAAETGQGGANGATGGDGGGAGGGEWPSDLSPRRLQELQAELVGSPDTWNHKGSAGFFSRRTRAASAAANAAAANAPRPGTAAAIEAAAAAAAAAAATKSYHHPSGVSYVDLGRGVPAGPSHEGLQPADPRAGELEAASRAALETLARRHGNSRKSHVGQVTRELTSPRGGVVPVVRGTSASTAGNSSRPGTSNGRVHASGGSPGAPSQRHRSRPGSRSQSTRGGGGLRRPSHQDGHLPLGPREHRWSGPSVGGGSTAARSEDEWDGGLQLHFSDPSDDEDNADGNAARGEGSRNRRRSRSEREGGGGGNRGRARSSRRERPRASSPIQEASTVVVVTITTASGQTSPVIHRTVPTGGSGASHGGLSLGGGGGPNTAVSRQSQRRSGGGRLVVDSGAAAATDDGGYAAAAADDVGLQRLSQIAGTMGMKVGGDGSRRRRTSSPRSTNSGRSLRLLLHSSSEDDDGDGEGCLTGPTATFDGAPADASVGADSASSYTAESPRLPDLYGSNGAVSPSAATAPSAVAAAAAMSSQRMTALAWDNPSSDAGSAGPYGSDGSRSPSSLAGVLLSPHSPVPLGRAAGYSWDVKVADGVQGLSRHYKLAGSRWNPAAPGALRPGYGAEFDYMAGTYNPELMEKVAAARDMAALMGGEMKVEYMSPLRAVSRGQALQPSGQQQSHPQMQLQPQPQAKPLTAARRTLQEGAKRGMAGSGGVAGGGNGCVGGAGGGCGGGTTDGGGGGETPAVEGPGRTEGGADAGEAAAPGPPGPLNPRALLNPAGRAAAVKARTAAAIADVLNPVSRAIVNASTLATGSGGLTVLPPPMQVLVHTRATDGGAGGSPHLPAGISTGGLSPHRHGQHQSTAAATAAVVRHLIPMPARVAAVSAADAARALDCRRSTGTAGARVPSVELDAVGDGVLSRTVRPSQSIWGRTDTDERDILAPLNQHLAATAWAASAAKAAATPWIPVPATAPPSSTSTSAGGSGSARTAADKKPLTAPHRAPWPSADLSSAMQTDASGRRAMTAPAGLRQRPPPPSTAPHLPPSIKTAEPRLWRGSPQQLTSAFPPGEKVYRLVTDVQSSARLLRDMEKDITPVGFRKRLRRGVVL